MSQRTIVEFNHDYAAEIEDKPDEFFTHLGRALRGGDKESWDFLERRFGLRRIVQCHHSDERSVAVRGTRYVVG